MRRDNDLTCGYATWALLCAVAASGCVGGNPAGIDERSALEGPGATRSYADSPNVLFISVDDLNDWIEPLGGHPQARTPNLDASSDPLE